MNRYKLRYWDRRFDRRRNTLRVVMCTAAIVLSSVFLYRSVSDHIEYLSLVSDYKERIRNERILRAEAQKDRDDAFRILEGRSSVTLDGKPAYVECTYRPYSLVRPNGL